MKKYYCVVTTVDDYGNTSANIVEVREAKTKPLDDFRRMSRKDIYIDWFESKEEAENYILTTC